MTTVGSANEKSISTHRPVNLSQKPYRRSLRRKIPYVESFEEQTSRELWEKYPFRGAKRVMDTIIGSENDSLDQSRDLQPVLKPIYFESENISAPSGYEDSFDLLYKTTEETEGSIDESNATISSGDGIMGIASIAKSPFAKIEDNHETRKEKLKNFCLRVAYRGDDFCGWQTQLDNTEQPSVQRTLEEWLTEFQNDLPFDAEENARVKKARRNEKQGRPSEKVATSSDIESTVNENASHRDGNKVSQKVKPKHSQKIRWADLPVAGRTDSGVSAIGQLCRFRTHRRDLTSKQISKFLETKIQNTPTISRSLRVTQVTPVTKAFHPTFTTSCRAYAYLIDIDSGADEGHDGGLFCNDQQATKQVAFLNDLLHCLEGKTLDYIGLSYGRVKTSNTLCTLHHARARLVDCGGTKRAICIELVGDRFLRRMVRLLVEALVRLVATESQKMQTNDTSPKNDCNDQMALLRLIEQEDRTLIGRPAPPDGLIFVAARVHSSEV